VEDIVPLAEHFLTLHGRRERKEHCPLSSGAARLLLAYAWPGNVRELENEMQRALALLEAGETISARTLSPTVAGALAPIEAIVIQEDSLRDNLHRIEAWIIRRSLEQHEGRRATTARKLGVTREGLYK
jgi:Nif-specific regulatory protein